MSLKPFSLPRNLYAEPIGCQSRVNFGNCKVDVAFMDIYIGYVLCNYITCSFNGCKRLKSYCVSHLVPPLYQVYIATQEHTGNSSL